jgi:tetratricopeptide (TPR) repeat protein
MPKSRMGRGGPIPPGGASARFGAFGGGSSAGARAAVGSAPRPGESFLASSKSWTPAPDFPSGAATLKRVSASQAREANRCACDGARLINEGRPAQAIPLLRRSVELHPGVASSHHDLGVALMHSGRLEQAAEAFAAALRLDPALPSAHHFLAYIIDSLGDDDRAIAGYEAAVALKPDLVVAQVRLGELYMARGRRADAAAAFRAAAGAAPGTVMARIVEARVLEASGAFDEALAAMRAIVEANPEHAEAHAALARLLGQAGLSAEAAAHYERVTQLSADLGTAWSGVALNKKFSAEDGPLIARMNAGLTRPNLTPRHRQALYFALGKAHDDMGNYEAAMRNFEAGNRLRARAGGLRRDALVRRVDQLIKATPPGYRERQPDPGVEDSTPVLIVGLPRSGSTLTEQILSSHPEVAAGGELEFWGIRDTPREDIWSITSTPEDTRRLADDYLSHLRAFGPGAKRVTDKALASFMLLGVVHRVFPNATLIHCRRNPIDTALSIYCTNFEMNLDFAANRSDLVFFFRQYQRLMAHWREVLPPDRFVEVDYEALVADPERHARRLIAACRLEWSDACLEPHRNIRRIRTASLWQARQPIYRTSVGRWQRYQPWLGELNELAAEG